MEMRQRLSVLGLAGALSLAAGSQVEATVVIPVQEDVMTSAFFFSPNFVRGYAGDNRNVHRVGSDNAFGVGPETVYLTFDPADFASLSGPLAPGSALLSVESASGGFGGDAGAGNPFTVSAHAVDTDPLAAITDDTNPSGPIDWLDFFNNNILPADPAALTAVDSFGTVEFDVTDIVNDWLDGTSNVYAIALTGKNDTSGNDFLHGFLNNTENPGSSFIVVPEPAASLMLLASGGLFMVRRSKNTRRPAA